MNKRVIYTDLDSLFDTVISYLGIIDPRLTREYLSNEYDVNNSYLYLSTRVFKEMFKDRDKRILMISKNSYGADTIKSIITDTITSNDIGRGVMFTCEVIINTYPYKLDDKELKEMEEFYRKYFLMASNVSVVYKPELSKAFVNKLNVCVMRFGLDWFMDTKTKDPSFKCPHLRLIVPNSVSNLKYFKKHKIDIDEVRTNLVNLFSSDVILDFADEELFMLRIDNELE